MNSRNRLKSIWYQIVQCMIDLRDDHISAYAAMSAFFFMLSLIPCILLVLTMLQYTPVSEASFIETVQAVFPSTIAPLVVSVVEEVFQSSAAVIPLTIVVALWSAGKGIMALSMGLNSAHDMVETRNYFVLRIRSTLYTVFFLIGIVATLVLQVFGKTLAVFLIDKAPFLENTVMRILKIHNVISVPLIVILTLMIYKFLPNKKIRILGELPGAIVCALAWLVLSRIFSAYLRVFTGFSGMYGSLTTIILIMIWLYFCMLVLLLGAEINLWVREYGLLKKIPYIGRVYERREDAYVEQVRRHHIEVMQAAENKKKKLEEKRQ